ncbi:hypothetical protein K437DRAFT_140767, partial [Tilletiaria anomala UBC 951]
RAKRRSERKVVNRKSKHGRHGGSSSDQQQQRAHAQAQHQHYRQQLTAAVAKERAAYHDDSDDSRIHTHSDSGSGGYHLPSDAPPTLLAAAALIAAAQVAVKDEHDMQMGMDGADAGAPAHASTADSSLSLLSTSSSPLLTPLCYEDMDAEEAGIYALHLGTLPDPIESLRNELLNPTELRFYCLPLEVAAHMKTLAHAEAKNSAGASHLPVQPQHQHQNQLHQHQHAKAPSSPSGASAPDSGQRRQAMEAQYVSLRTLEKDWDEWRWETMESGDVTVSLSSLSAAASELWPSYQRSPQASNKRSEDAALPTTAAAAAS